MNDSNSCTELPALSYLLIFNPTIASQDDDDDDEKERKQLLFYSAKEQAVSKDQILRQLGVAKALSKFTTIFNVHASCDSVHSLTRRMTMFSPEPNFWMLGCFEVGRLSRRNGEKGKEKGNKRKQSSSLETNESSLHDSVLKMKLQSAYEAFKLRHGSFTSTIFSLGREALELQLERFFTVWCWSWDFGRDEHLVDYIGVPVYPQAKLLQPIISRLDEKIPPSFLPIFLTPSYVLSPGRVSRLLSSLLRHLMELARVKVSGSGLDHAHKSDVSEQGIGMQLDVLWSNDDDSKKDNSTSKKFLGMPLMSLTMTTGIDMGKWSWQNYMPKGTAFPSLGLRSRPEGATGDEQQKQGDLRTPALQELEGGTASRFERADAKADELARTSIDESALSDALRADCSTSSKEDVSENWRSASSMPSASSCMTTTHDAFSVDILGKSRHSQAERSSIIAVPEPRIAQDPDRKTEALPYSDVSDTGAEVASFSEFFVYLDELTDPLTPHLKRLRYRADSQVILALIPASNDDDNLSDDLSEELARTAQEANKDIANVMSTHRASTSTSLSSPIQDILQRPRYAFITHDNRAYSSPSLLAVDWHLFEGHRMFDMGLTEVYSRGQNPQDWHLAKREFGESRDRYDDIYMEIRRKEASLVDVDNEASAVVRKYIDL